MRINDENLRGRTVISADGQALGVVAAMFIDTDDLRLDSIRVELRKDVAEKLGVNRSIFHRGVVEIPSRSIQSIGDAVVLNVPLAQLRDVPVPPEAQPNIH
jgi:sporulation protein YlmC with PRC-barrel domain